MDVLVLVFLGSGLFLGWSLGANDASNVFGTAVGTRMITFGTAAVTASVFVILGAVLGGAGAAETLGKLGAVNALPGAFMAALAAAATVYAMTKASLPVSTSQAIVGAIVGWNLYSGYPTDPKSLFKIVSTWIACPILAGLIAVLLFRLTMGFVRRAKIHLLRLDAYTRAALILAGAFGAYSLGANNIANVMGVFVSANPFTTFDFNGVVTMTGVQQLFLLGAIAIAVGIFTYSKKVMMTVGANLLPLSPVGAWVVVVAHSIVLFLFASEGVERLLDSAGLPTLPLVPVSSTQAVVGAVVGIGLLKGGRSIRWRKLGQIASGWLTTPLLSCGVCFVALFFLQNVFNQEVYQDQSYALTEPVLSRLERSGLDPKPLSSLEGFEFSDIRSFRRALRKRMSPSVVDEAKIIAFSRLDRLYIDRWSYPKLYDSDLSSSQIGAVTRLGDREYEHGWQFLEDLARQSEAWRLRPDTASNKIHNRKIERQQRFLLDLFRRTD